MAQELYANNAATTIAGSISNTSTTVTLATGAGALFPNPSAGQFFRGTFTDAATGLITEIVLVTARVGDVLTIVRGQEGTNAEAWSANDLFSNDCTAGAMSNLVQQSQAQTQSFNYGTDTGAANAYVCGLLPAIATAPPAGTPIRLAVAAGNTNTGASTLNAGWGAAPIVRRDGSACIGGELLGSRIVDLEWTGAAFQLCAPAPAPSAVVSAGVDTQSYVTPATLANASFAKPGTVTGWAARTAPTGWYLCIGGTANRVTDVNLFNAITEAQTVSITIASPGVVTWNNHGFTAGDIVSFETTGSLPTGLLTGTNYYVVSPTTNSFSVALTPGGAAINTSGSQTGTQTCRYNPYGCGDGTTTFGLPDTNGRVLFGPDRGSNRVTLAGSGVNPVLGGTGGAEVASASLSVSGSCSVSVSVSVSVFGSGTSGGASAQSSVGSIGGGSTNTWTNPHTHPISLTSSGSGSGSGSGSISGTASGNVVRMQPSLGMNFIIKR